MYNEGDMIFFSILCISAVTNKSGIFFYSSNYLLLVPLGLRCTHTEEEEQVLIATSHTFAAETSAGIFYGCLHKVS